MRTLDHKTWFNADERAIKTYLTIIIVIGDVKYWIHQICFS